MAPDLFTVSTKSGGICILNTKSCLRDVMESAASSVGLGRFVPERPPTTTTLRLAMHDVGIRLFGRQRKRPISVKHIDGDSFECVRVVANGDRNEYHHLFSASIDKNWNVAVIAHNHDQPGYMAQSVLEPAVLTMRDYLPSTVVSRVAVRMMTAWKAVPMAESGGVWFLPDSHVEEYRTFASILRTGGGKFSAAPKFTITTFDIDANPETAGQVLEKVRETVRLGIDEINSDIANATEGFSDRSIKVRLARANKLLSMVNEYRSLLGVEMPELTDAIEQAKQAVALHKLLSTSI